MRETRIIKCPEDAGVDLGSVIDGRKVVAMGLNQGQVDPKWGLAQGDNYLELEPRPRWPRGALCKCMDSDCSNPHFDQRGNDQRGTR